MACWYVISEEELLRALVEAKAGGDPDMILAEIFANSETEKET